jgi:23S rRNA pseudouridine1911/1915/1917 synthase
MISSRFDGAGGGKDAGTIPPMARNDGYAYEEQLGPGAEGVPLLEYLCRRYPHSSATEWSMRVLSGDVILDSRAAAPDEGLRHGARLTWRRPPWDEPEAPLAYDVLHDDGDVLAVSKPAGLPTLPGANFLQTTLLFQVRLRAPDAIAIHRLGRWTSGVVLFARHRRAAAELSRQLRAREIGKRYRALASGLPDWDGLTVDHPIGPVPHPWLGSVHAASAAGRPALSRIDVLERRADSFLCDVRIETGRPHQIRIHLAFAGHPLLGDPLYGIGGVPGPGSCAVPGAPGYSLHAAEAVFRHPSDGRLMRVSSPPPEALCPATSWNEAPRGVRLVGHEPAETRT